MTSHEKIEILILDDEKQFTEELHEFLQKSDFESFETYQVIGLARKAQSHVQ